PMPAGSWASGSPANFHATLDPARRPADFVVRPGLVRGLLRPPRFRVRVPIDRQYATRRTSCQRFIRLTMRPGVTQARASRIKRLSARVIAGGEGLKINPAGRRRAGLPNRV